MYFFERHMKLWSDRKGKERSIWIGRWRQMSIVIFRETSEVESYATSSGQLALLARLTHAIPFFLAATQRMLPSLRNLAKSFSIKFLWEKFSLAFYAFCWNRGKKYIFVSFLERKLAW